MPDTVDRTFSARLDCHYLLQAPEVIDSHTPLVLTLHGFGGNPEAMLQLTRRLFARHPVIAALQGPNQFFLSPATPRNASVNVPGNHRPAASEPQFRDAAPSRAISAQDVGYGWITAQRPAESIRLHRDTVRHVLDEAGREFAIPPERRLLVGFLQSVGLNYRFAATCPDAVRGVIAICGGLPRDWDDGPYKPVTAAVLHIARSEDEYYPPNVTNTYPDRLKHRTADVEFHLIDGGHRMPSRVTHILEPWLGRIIG